jgi:hypothetical protein
MRSNAGSGNPLSGLVCITHRVSAFAPLFSMLISTATVIFPSAWTHKRLDLKRPLGR